MKRENKDNSKGEIYLITCLETNKQYVGQAYKYVGKNLKPHGAKGRWHRHVSKAYNKDENYFSSNTIWYDIKKYGSDKFKLEVLEICNISELDDNEMNYISLYNTLHPNGYNILSGEKKQPKEKIFNETSRKNISAIHRKIQPDLPMYMVYVKPRIEHGSYEGYAIINHPKSRSKYFTSKKLSLEEKYNLASEYLKNLE